jgi:capsular exopolysaccharide synthesis family protein
MNVNEIFTALWHQKLILIATVAAFVGIGVGALQLVTKEYEATSTLALSPRTPNLSNLVFFQTIDAIIPIYAAAAQTDDTKNLARASLHGRLADISVRTFTGAPILKIVARGKNKALVRDSAQSVTTALQDRVATGVVGVPSLQLQQIDRPVYPTSPVFPRRNLTLAVAALLGIAFGVGAALLRESFTNKVHTSEALAEATGVAVYAEVPLENALARRVSPGLLLSYPALHGVTEALRDLRTNLLFPSGKVNSVVITSPEGGHGKTTIALGLAVTLARAGARTLLVDADLRRGRVSEFLDIERMPGLHEVLEGAPPHSVIRSTSLAELDVMTGGRIVGDPGELFAARFPDVLRQLELAYDTVVVDTTPLVPVGDARVAASVGAATVIVASAGAASRAAIRQAVERLALIAVSPSGAVLNKSRSRHARSYYGHPSKGDGSTDDGSGDEAAEQVRERI